jgi:hypothetical protein
MTEPVGSQEWRAGNAGRQLAGKTGKLAGRDGGPLTPAYHARVTTGLQTLAGHRTVRLQRRTRPLDRWTIDIHRVITA